MGSRSRRRKKKRLEGEQKQAPTQKQAPAALPELPPMQPDLQMLPPVETLPNPLPTQVDATQMPLEEPFALPPDEQALAPPTLEPGQEPPPDPMPPPPVQNNPMMALSLTPQDLKADRFNFLDDASRRDFLLMHLTGLPPIP